MAKDDLQKLARGIGYGVLGLAGAAAAATAYIGTKAVNYALKPKGGAEDRDVDDSDMDYSKDSEDILLNAGKAQDNVDQWKEEVRGHVEPVSVTSADGLALKGKMIHQNTYTPLWAVVVHGYQVTSEFSLPIARRFYNQGYNVLIFDQRGMGESDGKYIGMGVLEQSDLLKWTALIIERDPKAAIIYHGESMGGATVLFASGSSRLPENVKAVVADCPYSDVWTIFEQELNLRFNMPAFPFLYMADVMAQFHAGYSFDYDGSVLEAVKDNAVPTLIVTTEEDDFIPYDMALELYEAIPHADKELLLIENGGHAAAKFSEPQTYDATMFKFIDQYLFEDTMI